MTIEKVDNLLGYSSTPMNIWGKTTLLLILLYKAGLLPECHIYAKSEGAENDDGMYFINGHFVGKTEEEVTTNVWKMVQRNQQYGYLFE